MNTQKIVNKYGNKNERIDLSLRDRTVKLLAYDINSHRRFVGSKRREDSKFFSIVTYRIDVILYVFEFAADTFPGMAVQNFVQLQDIICRNGNIFVVLVNNIEGIAITDNLFLVACTRSDLVA